MIQIAEPIPVTCSTLGVLWNGSYNALALVVKLPDAWILPSTDVDSAAAQCNRHDIGKYDTGAHTDDVSIKTSGDPDERVSVEQQHPSDEPHHQQTQGHVGHVVASDMQKQKTHTKRHRLSDGEVDRRVARRKSVHVMHDGVFAQLRRSNKSKSVKCLV
jgi:hypothetical protein